MSLRIQSFLTGLLAFIAAMLLALAPVSANPTSGGYQLFEQDAPEHQAAIQLASLGNFDGHAKTASECCNVPNSAFEFSTRGSGTHLTRTTSIDGTEIRINSGHAYNRTHSGGDVSSIGTMDEIETAILNDVSSNSRLNGLSGSGNQYTIQVNGQTVIYELSDTPIGPVLGNYYPPNP